jgi:hypothetical protein
MGVSAGAGTALTPNTGNNNTFVGNAAGSNTTTGSNNIFLGYDAGNASGVGNQADPTGTGQFYIHTGLTSTKGTAGATPAPTNLPRWNSSNQLVYNPTTGDDRLQYIQLLKFI